MAKLTLCRRFSYSFKNDFRPDAAFLADSGRRRPRGRVHFLLNIVTDDLQANRYQDKRWAGKPGPAAVQQQGQPDPARIRTRFRRSPTATCTSATPRASA